MNKAIWLRLLAYTIIVLFSVSPIIAPGKTDANQTEEASPTEEFIDSVKPLTLTKLSKEEAERRAQEEAVRLERENAAPSWPYRAMDFAYNVVTLPLHYLISLRKKNLSFFLGLVNETEYTLILEASTACKDESGRLYKQFFTIYPKSTFLLPPFVNTVQKFDLTKWFWLPGKDQKTNSALSSCFPLYADPYRGYLNTLIPLYYDTIPSLSHDPNFIRISACSPYQDGPDCKNLSGMDTGVLSIQTLYQHYWDTMSKSTQSIRDVLGSRHRWNRGITFAITNVYGKLILKPELFERLNIDLLPRFRSPPKK
jgi:hypothetical protein